MDILEEYLHYRRVPEFFLYYLWNQSIQYLPILDNSPIPQSFTTTDPFVWQLITKFIICSVLLLRDVGHSAEVTQIPMAEVTNYSSLPSFTSKLSEVKREQPRSKLTFAHLSSQWVGFSTLCDILLAHANGENLHVCAESNQPIIHILLLVPLDEFNLLEKGFWLW